MKSKNKDGDEVRTCNLYDSVFTAEMRVQSNLNVK